jgi:adenosine deaminase
MHMIEALITRLPKCELHIHIEGSLEPDDPAYFGGYVNQNFRAVPDALGLGRDEIVALVRNGIAASLMTAAEKGRALKEIERVVDEVR